MKNLFAKIILFSILLSLLSGCIQQTLTGNTSQTVPTAEELRLSTTTSTCDTGLLDILNKKFEDVNNVKILTICQGTGKAIATGELGGADAVMVHDVISELKAVANGSFIDRSYIMYNYFVIIGPVSDPAGIRDAENATDAFSRIAAVQSPFISRGDESGTHKMEKSIWKAANITPAGAWYKSAGKGMGDTITTADIMEGYTLSDRGTYLAMKDRIKLRILFESDKEYLFNPYHIMAVSPDRFQDVKYELAKRYIDFLTSASAQDIIRDYGKDRYGEGLFIPADALDK